MYDETAGIQCRSNAIIAVCFSAVKNVSIWKSWDLDFILDQGDILMQSLSLSLNIEGFDLAAFSIIMIYLHIRKIFFPLTTFVIVKYLLVLVSALHSYVIKHLVLYLIHIIIEMVTIFPMANQFS